MKKLDLSKSADDKDNDIFNGKEFYCLVCEATSNLTVYSIDGVDYLSCKNHSNNKEDDPKHIKIHLMPNSIWIFLLHRYIYFSFEDKCIIIENGYPLPSARFLYQSDPVIDITNFLDKLQKLILLLQ